MRAVRTISLGLASVIALALHSYILGFTLLCPAALARHPPSTTRSNRNRNSPPSHSHSHSPWIDCKVSPRARTLGDFRCPSLAASASPHAQHHHAGTHAAHAETHAARDAADGSGGGDASPLPGIPGGLHGGVASPPPGRTHGGTAWSQHYVESVLALRHAPLLYHHPLERHFLTDPVKVWAGGIAGFGLHMLALSLSPLLYHNPLDRQFLKDPVKMCGGVRRRDAGWRSRQMMAVRGCPSNCQSNHLPRHKPGMDPTTHHRQPPPPPPALQWAEGAKLYDRFMQPVTEPSLPSSPPVPLQWAEGAKLYDRFMRPVSSSGSDATPHGSVTRGGSGDGNSTDGQGATLQPELFHSFLCALDTPEREEAMLGSGFDAEGRYWNRGGGGGRWAPQRAVC